MIFTRIVIAVIFFLKKMWRICAFFSVDKGEKEGDSITCCGNRTTKNRYSGDRAIFWAEAKRKASAFFYCRKALN